jgi:hypothetical protein
VITSSFRSTCPTRSVVASLLAIALVLMTASWME